MIYIYIYNTIPLPYNYNHCVPLLIVIDLHLVWFNPTRGKSPFG